MATFETWDLIGILPPPFSLFSLVFNDLPIFSLQPIVRDMITIKALFAATTNCRQELRRFVIMAILGLALSGGTTSPGNAAESPNTTPPGKPRLQGIVSASSKAMALLEFPGRQGSRLSYILSEGERDGDVEVI